MRSLSRCRSRSGSLAIPRKFRLLRLWRKIGVWQVQGRTMDIGHRRLSDERGLMNSPPLYLPVPVYTRLHAWMNCLLMMKRRGFKCSHTEWGPWAIFDDNMQNTLVTTGRQVVFILLNAIVQLSSIHLKIKTSEATYDFRKPTSYDWLYHKPSMIVIHYSDTPC